MEIDAAIAFAEVALECHLCHQFCKTLVDYQYCKKCRTKWAKDIDSQIDEIIFKKLANVSYVTI